MTLVDVSHSTSSAPFPRHLPLLTSPHLNVIPVPGGYPAGLFPDPPFLLFPSLLISKETKDAEVRIFNKIF